MTAPTPTPLPATPPRPNAVRPSPVFLATLAAFAAGTALCVFEIGSAGFAVFVFVVAGWIVSLIFHEFAHAYTAYRGGDVTVVEKGYLSLDPRLYADPLTSIAFPIFLVLAGGIGLPGGAVWINRGLLRSKGIASFVSLAGPATNLVFATLCLLPLSVGLVDRASWPVLAPALAFLGFLQVTAFILNMLPIPGLDGFGAIEPHLPRNVLVAIAPIRRYAMMVLFVALWFVEPVRDVFWSLIRTSLDLFAIDPNLPFDGYSLFRFWE